MEAGRRTYNEHSNATHFYVTFFRSIFWNWFFVKHDIASNMGDDYLVSSSLRTNY